MMQDIDIIINTDSIRMSKSGAITGEIFFSVSDDFFPEENWNDFIVIVLGWWLNTLKSYDEKEKSEFEMCFMDGPFSIKAKKNTEDILELSFIRDIGKGQEILFVAECFNKEFKKKLLTAVRKVLRNAEIEQWPKDTVEGLRKGMSFF